MGGGPLLCKDDEARNAKGKLIQVGVTAWGVGCGGDLPGVYSKLSSAMCWIDQVMSCNPEPIVALELGIRNFDTASQPSVNRMTKSECGAWQEADENVLHSQVCDCFPELLEQEEEEYEYNDFDAANIANIRLFD